MRNFAIVDDHQVNMKNYINTYTSKRIKVFAFSEKKK